MQDKTTYNYGQIITELRVSYNRTAEERDESGISDWKVEERQRFLVEIQREQKKTLLEVGSGPGRDGKFFQDHGLQVICTDLSPKMVETCKAKGLEAYIMDFLHLDFPEQSFDCVFALNSLLHVPKADIEQVLLAICQVLKPSGLFYLGVYGGKNFEGKWPEDHHEPKRFFSLYPDQEILALVTKFFELVYFRKVPIKRGGDFHFQSFMLRRRPYSCYCV